VKEKKRKGVRCSPRGQFADLHQNPYLILLRGGRRKWGISLGVGTAWRCFDRALDDFTHGQLVAP